MDNSGFNGICSISVHNSLSGRSSMNFKRSLTILLFISVLGCHDPEKEYVRNKQSSHPDCNMQAIPKDAELRYTMDHSSLLEFRRKVAQIQIGNSRKDVVGKLGSPSMQIPIARQGVFLFNGFRSRT